MFPTHVELCFGPLFVPKKHWLIHFAYENARYAWKPCTWGNAELGDVLATSTLGFLSTIPKYPDLTPSNSVYKRGHGGRVFSPQWDPFIGPFLQFIKLLGFVFSRWFFTDSIRIYHHHSPPFGIICFDFFPSIKHANPRINIFNHHLFRIPSLKLQVRPWKLMVGTRAILVLGSVTDFC